MRFACSLSILLLQFTEMCSHTLYASVKSSGSVDAGCGIVFSSQSSDMRRKCESEGKWMRKEPLQKAVHLFHCSGCTATPNQETEGLQ